MEDIQQSAACQLAEQFSLPEITTLSFEAFKKILAQQISYYLHHDFEQLVAILYWLDIDENRIRQVMHAHADDDPAPGMADLIIERQLQKAATRAAYRTPPVNDDDPEKW